MKLLIITQKVDKNDPILGFFHGWVEEFAKNVEKLTVVCLGVGEYDLPQNVQVFSLGKKIGASKLKYIWNFYKYIFKLRNEYDAVFVHMNKEYVILGGLFWKLWNKRVALWYNHPFGDFMAKVSVFLSNNVFYTSPQAFTSKYKKSKQMSAGIDTNLFKKNEEIEKNKNSLLFLGRISPIKNLDLFIDSVISINKSGNDLKLDIFGGPANLGDYSYADELKKRTKEQNRFIKFNEPIANYKTPQIFNEHELFVNLTP
ncbi:MAG: glycosyltransferase, partial [Patescibacteria group bacterium]